MPKRKYNDSDSDEYILKKIKKLERKLLRRRKRSSPPLSSPSPLPPEENPVTPVEIRSTPSPQPELDIEQTLQQETQQDIMETTLDEDIMKMLGSNNNKSSDEMGQKIHEQIAERWENIIQNGLEKNEKENILQQNYILPPSNCPHLVVPKINPETLAACSEINKKRDFTIEARQKMLSHAITALASATERVLLEVQPKELKLILLEILNNTGKILADIFHNENKTRRNLIISGLEKDVRDTLLQTKPDKYLFGDNLFEKIKTAKSVGNTGREIRLQPKLPPKSTQKATQSLNWRGPPRLTQKHLPMESRPNKNRSNGPQQTVPAQKRAVAAPRVYRKTNYNNQRHRRN